MLKSFPFKASAEKGGFDEEGYNKQNRKGDLSSLIFNWFTITVYILVESILVVLLFGTSTSGKATIAIWMLACMMSGCAIGFLFGIPKILQANQMVAGREAEKVPYQQQVNTNLTEISDWLTKIIVGLGLVNLTKIPPYLSSVANILAKALGTNKNGPTDLAIAFAFGIIITYTILGFLLGYITTRLYLAVLFSKADKEALSLTQVAKKADEAAGAAQSAMRKVEFALSQPTLNVESSDLSNLPKSIDVVNALIEEYNQTRSSMKYGASRTSHMTKIVKQLSLSMQSIAEYDVTSALRSDNNGKRLAGYIFLYVHPEESYIDELVNAFVNDQTRFGQYWGILALGNMLETKPEINTKDGWFIKLRAYFNNLKDGVDRKYELSRILPELKST